MSQANPETNSVSDIKKSSQVALTLTALGVVLGDIGTSPLYAVRESFGSHYGLPVSDLNILGILSLIFWSLTLMISIKYLGIILRADNKGEGGILSLMSLVVSTYVGQKNPLKKKVMIVFGLIGAALLYGDGVITPAISVLSAMEGLSIATPMFESWIVPLTLIVLNAFFLSQRFGTAKIGQVFGPIILVWFIILGVLGASSIVENPLVLKALNPWWGVDFFLRNQGLGYLVLGSVVLAVTGGEALYADMGHFGKVPIRQAWFFVAMPGLVLNYFGQGALLLRNPEAITNPFYLLAPDWALIPLVVLATMATVIASQALISGIFSLTRQGIQLGFWPRIGIVHTSKREIGQIYVPFVNWALFAGVVWLVLSFRSSSNLASAYGIAITATMVITSILAFEVARRRWNWSNAKSFFIFGGFLIADISFFGANIVKIGDGGWVPIVIGGGVLILMLTWSRGRRILYLQLKKRSMPIETFCQSLLKNPPVRVPGTAIYMSGDPWGVPVPLLHNLKHNKVLHEKVAILTIQTKEIPTIDKEERIKITEITSNLFRIIASYGYMETPKMKHILDACRDENIHFRVDEITFVLGRETILPSREPGMPLWQEKLFALMSRNAQRPTAFFKIPPNQVIEVGIQVEI